MNHTDGLNGLIFLSNKANQSLKANLAPKLYVNDEMEMLTDINSTRCFRLGLVMMVNDLEVNYVNFLTLTAGK